MKCNKYAKLVLCYILLLITTALALGQDRDLSGPPILPALGLVQTFQFSPTLFGASEVQSGRWYQSTVFNWINVWAFNVEAEYPYRAYMDPTTFPFKYGTFLVDYEGLLLTQHIGYRLTDRFDFILAVPVQYIGGGSMDGHIEAFHDALGISQHRRSDLPRNQIHMFFVDREGRQHWLGYDEVGGGELGDVTAYMGYRLRSEGPEAIARFAVKFPTQTAADSIRNRGFDFALTSAIDWNWNGLRCNHGAGITYSTHTHNELPRLYHLRGTASLSTELPVIQHSVSVIAHLIASTPSASYPQLDEQVIELTFGLRLYRGRSRIDIGLIENMFFYDNSPDFGVHLTIVTR